MSEHGGELIELAEAMLSLRLFLEDGFLLLTVGMDFLVVVLMLNS